MFTRALITALLIFAASVGDHALPVLLHSLPVLPSLLDLALLLVCLHLRGGESVFWAGWLGLLNSDFAGGPVGQGIFIAATLAVICQQWLSPQGFTRSLLDRALWGVLVLAILFGTRVAFALLLTGTWPAQPVLILLLAKLAATFLLYLICQSLVAAVSLWRAGRSNFHEFAA